MSRPRDRMSNDRPTLTLDTNVREAPGDSGSALLPRKRQSLRLLPDHVPEPSSVWPARVLVASDGSPPAETAVVAGLTLAARSCATIEEVAIYSPNVPPPAGTPMESWSPSDRRAAAKLLRDVRRQRRSLSPVARSAGPVPVRIEIGDVGPAITRVASERDADLIVLGIRSSIASRRRTAICAARYATVPILAAAQGADAITRAVFALPEGGLDPATARAATALLLPHSRIWFAVRARPGVSTAAATQQLLDEIGAGAGDEWNAKARVHSVDLVEMDGDPVVEVLRIAERVRAQLIVVRNHGTPGPVRAFLPNIVQPLLFAAPCSVLVVPIDGSRAGS